ncbi:MAG: menaquinone biosynthesis protein, partial [Ignavibacteria bacterium]|nr:menaquinone biosynthesis protein [Ignavibacteria bacterium]
RDVYYNPLNLYTSDVIGKIPYLNSLPFYHHFENRQFKMLPVTPRRMGVLARNNQLDAGLFSLADYLSQKDALMQLPYCIATRDQVKSVMLFSNHGWRELAGKTIGIVDDTATSVRLLQVLLEKRYGVKAEFRRMHSGVNSYDECDAVLMIGDEAMRHQKTGLQSFELVYDLASEWYQWQNLPFVFAVWAVRKSLTKEKREELSLLIQASLKKGELDLERISVAHAKRIGWSSGEAMEYLEGFNYHLGEREREAIGVFEGLLTSIEGEAEGTMDGSQHQQN